MASAMIGGLIKEGVPAHQIRVVDPAGDSCLRLKAQFGIDASTTPDSQLSSADMVVWAVKPQSLKEATLQYKTETQNSLHLSVAAGIRSDSISHWLNTDRVVRAMPNTPALVGLGQTGLFARAGVSQSDKEWIEKVIHTTGDLLWVNQESLLDSVTAISGSGPAYVFFFIEAMIEGGVKMGLSNEQAKQLAIGTFIGASNLAQSSTEPISVLREKVTSKGGTTFAAINSMQQAQMSELFQTALMAAQKRAHELGDEFGR